VPASSDGDTAADHTISRNSPSVELSQLQQCVIDFHISPAPDAAASSHSTVSSSQHKPDRPTASFQLTSSLRFATDADKCSIASSQLDYLAFAVNHFDQITAPHFTAFILAKARRDEA